jgi:hypothetical protein
MHLHHKAARSICEVKSCMRPPNTTYNKTGHFCYQHRTGLTRLGDLFDVDDASTADVPFEGTVNKDVKINRIDTQEESIIVTVRICSKYMCTSPILIRLRDTVDVQWSDKMNRILNMEDVDEYIPQQKPVTPKKLSPICACSGCARPMNVGHGPSGMQCYRHRKRCQTPSSMPGSRKDSNPRNIRWDTCEDDTECLDVTRPFCGKGGICIDKR